MTCHIFYSFTMSNVVKHWQNKLASVINYVISATVEPSFSLQDKNSARHVVAKPQILKDLPYQKSYRGQSFTSDCYKALTLETSKNAK